jgi:hypothetical protein
MVAEEQPGHGGIELVEAVLRQTVRGGLDDLVEILLDDDLDVVDAVDVAQFFFKRRLHEACGGAGE